MAQQNRILKNIFVSSIMVLILISSMSFAQNKANLKSEYFTYKSAVKGLARLEYYVQISNEKLHFFREGKHFVNHFTATLYLFDASNTLIRQQDISQDLSYVDFDKTVSTEIVQNLKFNLNISGGRYRSLIVVIDDSDGSRFQQKGYIEVPDYFDTNFHISSIKLSSHMQKAAFDQRPNLDHFYSFQKPEIAVYYESYLMENVEALQTTYRIEDEEGKVIHKFGENLPAMNLNPAFEFKISAASLPSGTYRLKIEQSAEGYHASSQTWFTVQQSPVDLRFKDYDTALDELKYLAGKEELKRLRSVYPKDQQAALNRFWISRDPAHRSVINPVMLEYYARINRVNALFSRKGRPGWRTDFGMIYIMFGRPDVVYEQKRSNNQDVSKQLWLYKKLHLSFTFISSNYFSDFSLLDRQAVYADYVAD